VVASGADTVTFSVIGFVLLIAAVAVWRVVIHDPRIRKVRFGVFYERERCGEDEPEEDEHGH
jgi:hypothetical protein